MDSSGCSEIVEVKVDAVGSPLERFQRLRVKVRSDCGSGDGKKPAEVGSSQGSRSEALESVNLKQAMRRACISQAADMVAAKRLMRPVAAAKQLPGKMPVMAKKVAPPEKLGTRSSSHPASPSKAKTPKVRIQDIISDDSIGSNAILEVSPTNRQLIEKWKPRRSPRRQPSPPSQVHQNKMPVRRKAKPESVAFPKHIEYNKSTPRTASKKPLGASDAEKHGRSTGEHSVSMKYLHASRIEYSRSREKGETSQSSKSSIGEYSSSTSISEDSIGSFWSKGGRPHMSKDRKWAAVRHAALQQGGLGMKSFNLLKKLGSGDIGTVYLAEMIGFEHLFAVKVMDIEYLISRKKILRAQTEREILQMLDHPFLPTLYSHFVANNLLCLVMEYCPGGDLHVLRQKQESRSFSEPEARFYVAEVLLALEYLHMLGVIYRDLKPENILVREDGHIMLSDFDLSLRCSVSPVLLRSSSPQTAAVAMEPARPSCHCSQNGCANPSWVPVSCFTPRLLASSVAKANCPPASKANQLLQLVVEPTDARSNSFVGTHEYLAPEIVRSDGHGSSVDWWTLGVFLYELLFGRTPFKGLGNEETLTNIVSQSLKFPEAPSISMQAKDLIRGLLAKEPKNRLGSVTGAAEIKRHPFFDGLNWALIRSTPPPEMPAITAAAGTPAKTPSKRREGKCLEFMKYGGDVEFELF